MALWYMLVWINFESIRVDRTWMTFQSMFFGSVTYLYGAAGTELQHESNNEK